MIFSIDLEIDESSLTGETEARRKGNETCLYENVAGKPSGQPVALADRTCVAYMGTLVRNGASYHSHIPSLVIEVSA